MKKVLNIHKKAFVLIVLCMLSYSAFCQQDITKCHPCFSRCEILNNLLKDSTVQRFFNFKSFQYKDTPIIIIDTSRFFDKCSVENINGRMTKIVTDSSITNQINSSNILIYSHLLGRKKYVIEIYSTKTHGYGWVWIKERNKKFFSIKCAFGILD
ncbi:hypothetical protein SAMN05518672_1011327 [Chitinophaga sp. CF118]|uniref:hypothetical protein n=1 Tax=Chitinophaga sp. CF118 TaxID=1884367 RepID=UPI0008F40DFD|nr:hypothetical protein [Chitinophaga sp. CF118]SFD26063.1 hypothetical protein SAMN05518672_1011327 [Chitinophaga sp. CF118]